MRITDCCTIVSIVKEKEKEKKEKEEKKKEKKKRMLVSGGDGESGERARPSEVQSKMQSYELRSEVQSKMQGGLLRSRGSERDFSVLHLLSESEVQLRQYERSHSAQKRARGSDRDFLALT
jgi:hypothetical protein